jgi:hypothetical protein
MLQSRSFSFDENKKSAFSPISQRSIEQLVERKKLGCGTLFVDWKNSRKTEIFLNSNNSTMIKVSIPNTYQMVDIRKSPYIGFFRFSKINCGINFINAVVSGLSSIIFERNIKSFIYFCNLQILSFFGSTQ